MSASGHREIDHTADLGFDLWAETLPSLFAEAVIAFGDLCYDRAAVRSTDRRRLEVRGASLEELLVHWLQEVYLLLETELWLTAEAVDVVVGDEMIEGTLRGEPVDRARHTLHCEIKAITYHGLEIVQRNDSWRATVVVDV